MEDDFCIMTATVMQYLDDVRTIIKDSHAIKTENRVEISSIEQIMDDQHMHDIDFNFDEQGGNFQFDQNSEANPIENFDQKLSIHDDDIKNDEKFELKDPREEDKYEMFDQNDDVYKSLYNDQKVSKHSQEADKSKTTKSKSDNSTKDDPVDNANANAKIPKPRITNKERARKARQRKK